AATLVISWSRVPCGPVPSNIPGKHITTYNPTVNIAADTVAIIRYGIFLYSITDVAAATRGTNTNIGKVSNPPIAQPIKLGKIYDLKTFCLFKNELPPYIYIYLHIVRANDIIVK
ncbi:MAG: hypothetical protein RR351_04330, partial [Christensenella sp.]